MSLSEGEAGGEYEIVEVPQRKENANRLLPFDILPGSSLRLLDNPPFGALMVGRGGDEIALSREIASEIRVEPRRKRKRHREGMRSKG